MIKLDKINISYERPIFSNAQIELNAGMFNVLVGESGCGKTTLLNEIGLLNGKLHSEYEFNDCKLDNQSDFALIRRSNIGYVFQENYLFEKLTVKENIIFSANLAGLDLSDEEVEILLKKTKTERLIDKKINELSGGECQRVAISFALAKKPKLLLFDEPTSYLDMDNCILVIDIIKEIVATNEAIVFVVSHDQRIISSADNIYKIENAKIICNNVMDSFYDSVESYKRNNTNYEKAIKHYLSKSKANISKILYLILSFIVMVLLFNVGYSSFYREYIEHNIINSSMEEIRIYYGPKKRKPVNDINKYIPSDYLKKIKNLDGIKDVVPFYELTGLVDDNDVLIQTYCNNFNSKIYKQYQNESNIYVSNSLKGLLKEDQLSLMFNGYNYDLKITGVLNDGYVNNYSENGNKIIYIPVDKFNKLMDTDNIEPYLYILKFDSNVNLNKVMEQIKHIDKDIVIYSSVDIDKLQLLNTQLLSGIENVVKILFGCVIILILYDKSKLIISRKHELALLYANGLSKNKILQILFLESFDYSKYALIAADFVSILILVLFFSVTMEVLVSYLIINIMLFMGLNLITLLVSNYLLNRFSIKTLLSE